MPFKSNKAAHLIIVGIIICLFGIGTYVFFMRDFFVPRNIEQANTPTNSSAAIAPTEALDKYMSQASVERGRVLAHLCIECHTFDEDGPNRFGPNLFGIYGNHHASKENYAYSDALKALRDKIWTAENLNAWLSGPLTYAPGNKMGYRIVPQLQSRADIIAYLKTLKGE